jgi:anthranilate phosphoribosyltransferase
MTHEIQPLLLKVVERENLTVEESARAFQMVMSGGMTPAQIAAFLVALRMKGETVAEIVGAVQAMRLKALPFTAPEGAIDTCGTGGDGQRTYNISTAAAIVTAGCGVPVVKHGNRSVSSHSGSADVLSQLGINIQASPETMQRALAECGLCFLMAPAYHKAMRNVAPIRQELRLRTLYNLLGPLSNPAQVKRQLIGVFDKKWLQPLAEVLRDLGTEKAWLVHSEDGMDELSISALTHVVSLDNGAIKSFTVAPEDAGLDRHDITSIKGGLPDANARALEQLLKGQPSAYRDIVLLNSAAALIVAGRCNDLREGVALATQSIDSGKARAVLDTLILITKAEDAHG